MRQETQTSSGKLRSIGKSTAAKTKTRKAVVTTYSGTEQLSPEHRYHMIAEAAYFYAEERGFCNGSELDDWLRAEASVDEMLHNGNGITGTQ
jgi:hypothetical protein